MPLFEIGDEELVPFQRVQAGPDLYEAEIEELMWDNLEHFTGVSLFPLARQPVVGDGIRPDIVALDAEGHVYVIEIKRDVDRRQLAQCLEYAGWARNATLDELANLFHAGSEEFFVQWIGFTDTAAPVLIKRPPRLVLVAHGFDARTDSALTYLSENELPILVLGVSVYRDADGRRFIDVAADHEVELDEVETPEEREIVHFKIDGRRVQVADLIEASLLEAGTELVWQRPRLQEQYRAVVNANGSLTLSDGRTYGSPSKAAKEAAGIVAYDGWHAWRNSAGQLLSDLRADLLAGLVTPTDGPASAGGSGNVR